jgi:hypothetical protein
MDTQELVIAVMREVEREASKSRLSEKAREQTERPRKNLFASNIRLLPLPSIHFAPAS